MRQRLLLSGLCLISSFSLFAQIIITEPVFPTVDDQVTITFDANEGTGGLKDCDCDIYLHTGVLTDLSTGNSDWKYVKTTWGQVNDDWKMTPVEGEANKYTYVIGPSIRQYYSVPEGEAIKKMTFVFRNADGSKEGKGTGNTDVLYDVFDESLQINLTTPTDQVLLINPGDDILVQAQTNITADLSILQDGKIVIEAKETTAISFTFDADTDVHNVEVRAVAGEESVSKRFVYVPPLVLPFTPLPATYADGLTEIDDNTAFFQLHAPSNRVVFLIGDFNDWQPSADNLMKRTSDGTFWLQVDNLDPNQGYTYQYLVDEGIRTADPLSTLVLDPNNDPFISAETFPNMPAYPTGKTSGIVSYFEIGKTPFNWQVNNFQAPPKEELVIYELLLRDFTERSDYQTLKDTLDYLDRLGVNAIQLMPVSEFEANDSWGYNPSFHMALDKYYGSPEAFKAFVDECHNRGIAVILDVVYNHAFSQSPLAQLDWDAAAFKPTDTNPWLNVDAKHPFNVGYDFNHDSPHTRRFVDRVMQYWLEEYKVDGFRFDLSKGFTQRQTSDVGIWSSFDANRISILKHYADVMWSVNSEAYVILEHFADNSEETELTNYGMMSWAGGGVHNEYLEAAMGFESDLNGAAYTSRNWDNPHLIAYIESHDEERLVYKAGQFGNSDGEYNIKDLPTSLERSELAAAFFYTIPGPKMLWQFGELGFGFSINTCEDGSINENCRLSRKPIRWDYLKNADRKRVFDVVSGLIHLKTTYDVFNTTDFTLDVGSNTQTKKIFLNSAEMDVVVQGNFDVTTQTLTTAFSNTGWWYDYFSGDSILVENASLEVDLAPGEYHVYTSVRLSEPPNGFPTATVELVSDYFQLKLSPNPSMGPLNLQYRLNEGAQVSWQILDATGRVVEAKKEGWQSSSTYNRTIPLDLTSGIYWLKLQAGLKAEVKPFVLNR